MAHLQRRYATSDMWAGTWQARVQVLVLLVLVLALPAVLSSKYQNIAVLALLACMGAIALNLVLGIAGQISIANAAFMAVGGYAAATFATMWGWPVVPTLVVSGLVGALLGALVGLPSLRLRGIYLVVATLALHYIVLYAAQRYQGRYAGPAGFAMPFPLEIGPIVVESYRDWYYFVLIFVVATIVVMKNLMRTSFGRAWLFVRSAEPAAETLGINVARYKVLAFVLSSFLISVQGALFAYFQGLITYESYTFQLAVQYVAMLIIGGMGSIAGATVGAILLTSMPFVLEDAFRDLSGSQIGNLQLLVYGLAMIAFLLFAPGGIAEMGSRFKQYVTSWPIRRIDSRGIRSATSPGIVSAARGLEPIGEPA